MTGKTLDNPSLDWKKGWNPCLGLWRHYESDCHSSSTKLTNVHVVSDAAARLLVAAQAACLDKVDVITVLEAIRNIQVLDGGPKHGMLRICSEGVFPGDDHAVFLGGIALLALWGAYRQDMDDTSRKLLSDILVDLGGYCLLRAREKNMYYPNEFLGYVVCAWLAMEFFQLPEGRQDLSELLEHSTDYLSDNGWGWGEHISGIYGRICIDELSLLLLLAKDLPGKLWNKARKLLIELVEIDDFFAGGSIVPVVRTYAFKQVPAGWCYRDHIQALPADATFDPDFSEGFRLATCSTQLKTANGRTWLPIGHTFYKLGWHKLAGRKKAMLPKRSKMIRCVNGATATAFIDNNLRLGSLSCFPLMPTAESINWGLSWQSFPVVLWQRKKLWGYPQWEVFEAGQKRCHPAIEKYDTPRSLTTSVQAPIVGRNYARQQEGDLLALRVMPAIASIWDELIDRFRFVGGQTKIISESSEGNWSQLVLDCGSRQIAIQCLRLAGGPRPRQIKTSKEILDWSICYEKDELTDRRGVVNLWGVSMSGPVKKMPVVLPDPQAKSMPCGDDALALLVRWEWPNCSWNLKINLQNAESLQILEPAKMTKYLRSTGR